MKNKKDSDFSFVMGTKESFKERLRMLIGERSVRAAANDWGIPFSTLNNYLTKDTDPALSNVQSIAYMEQVSLDWLVNGSSGRVSKPSHEAASSNETSTSPLQPIWLSMLDAMSNDDALALVRLVHRKGIERLLALTEDNSDVVSSIENLRIRPTLKQAIKMALAGDERMDKEILHRLEQVQNSSTAGTDVTREQADSRNVG
ncbi:bacteriophage CI repressor [Shigella sonnei]|nr:transcriptional regulator [Shigella sonnei]EFZ0655750.1 bacteriophage CI repressor [Shigella sonnei]EFZ2872793.1 bacteriophage CI repressor [Shigella sonnei]EFZ3697857.1 bacteriophage CI repressor [Shigella sonnei]EKY7370489.1 transcriptional regulator [Shigella sonnei]